MEKEVSTLTGMLDDPKRPFCAILGGSKVSDKIQVIDALLDKCDTLVIGGGMCFTFLLAQGYSVGTSLKEEDWVERAGEMIEKAEEKGVKLLLPVDVVCADKFAEDAATKTVDIDAIPDDMMGLDIGPKTAKLYADAIAEAKTVFWNGPMGVFEMDAFAEGTRDVALAVADNEEADTIIGGGDSVAAVNKFDLGDRDDLHLHRRRRFHGARGRQGAARRRAATGLIGNDRTKGVTPFWFGFRNRRDIWHESR